LLAESEIEQVFAREQGRILILAAGQSPAVAERLIYYTDPLFAGQFDPPA
jgi:type IV secretory pathway TraG/TraD family ATPase VirD4